MNGFLKIMKILENNIMEKEERIKELKKLIGEIQMRKRIALTNYQYEAASNLKKLEKEYLVEKESLEKELSGD